MPFKIAFNPKDYIDIFPPRPPDNEVINADKANWKDWFWQKQRFPKVLDYDFIYREGVRLKQGVWILIKDVPMWIPPNYYQFLQYGNAAGKPPEFRLKRLKTLYKHIRARKDPRYVGTYNIKNRQDGDTTFAMNNFLWEVHGGELTHGMEFIQSKTRDDAINPCWLALKSQWLGYPRFIKDNFYPYFTSGDAIQTKMEFMQEADPNDLNDFGKNIVLQYGPAVFNAADGKMNVRRCFLDEINKWMECSFWDTFTNYMQFMMPGRQRKGLFDIVSSPADKNGIWNEEAEMFWKMSDPDNLNVETGSTFSRIYRTYSNPLDGIDGFFDEFGDADPQEVLEHILRERRATKADKLMAKVRAYPLPILGTDKPNEEEIFGATDSTSIWINKEGIKKRRDHVKDRKNEYVEYGNYEWPNNVPDSGDPLWRRWDGMNFDNEHARFCRSFTYLPKIELLDLKIPPHMSLIEHILGCDPFNLRYGTRNKITGSLGAGVLWRCRDHSETGIIECPTEAYLARPWHQSIFMEDMILSCVANRAMFQYERKNTDLEKYFEDRGYLAYMLVTEGVKPIETPDGKKYQRGDAPEGRGANAFLNMWINLINGVTNKPLTPEEKYLLDNFNFEEVLSDVLDLNKDNTEKSHLTIALGQSLVGRNKILFKPQKKKSEINNLILDYFED